MRRSLCALVFLFGFISFQGLKAQVSMFATFPPVMNQGSSTVVDIKIVKPNVSNFAKYMLDVPKGITVSEIDSKAGSFTFENNRVKIVWVAIPTEAEIILKFKITVGGDAPDKALFTQKFYYMEGGSKKEIELEPVPVTIEGIGGLAGSTKKYTTSSTPTETVASKFDDPKNKPVSDKATKTESAETTKPVATPKSQPTSTPITTETTPKTESKPKPEPVETTKPVATPKSQPATPVTPGAGGAEPSAAVPGLVYKIQLAALPTEPARDKYAALGEKLVIVKEDGMYKVQYSSYTTKEEALKGLEELSAKGFKGFLAKYQDGKRVK